MAGPTTIHAIWTGTRTIDGCALRPPAPGDALLDVVKMRIFPASVLALLLILVTGVARACTVPVGFDEVRTADVTVFGEYHGTNEIPAFFFDVVCTMALDSKATVVVGLELPDEFNAIFQAAGATPTTDLVKRLSDNVFWDVYGDGRHSRAMLRLSISLLELASTNPHVRLVAFARRDIDSAGADFLNSAINEHDARKTLILVGNAHARLTSMKGGVTPLAAVLKKHHGRNVLSFNISAGGGQAWACLAAECAARQIAPVRRAPGIQRGSCRTACPYSGTFHLETLSVSPAVGAQ